MRFKTSIKNVNTFISRSYTFEERRFKLTNAIELTASLNLLGKVAWVRLDNDQVRFTVIPEQGSQVWAYVKLLPLAMEIPTNIEQRSGNCACFRNISSEPCLTIQETIFEDYTIQSAAANNTINLEVPLALLHRALKSAQSALSASLRLTKKDDVPLLSLTIQTQTPLATAVNQANNLRTHQHQAGPNSLHAPPATDQFDTLTDDLSAGPKTSGSREMTITQSVPVRVLTPASIEGIHEPRCRPPDVHILLPPLQQLKGISERYTKLGLGTAATATAGASGWKGGGGAAGLQGGVGPRLELAANMHGELRLGVRTDGLRIQSVWTGLGNPELDPGMVEGGEEGVAAHPSTRMKGLTGDEAWAVVRVEGRDWGRVLGVGRLGGRVIACEFEVMRLVQ
jgi:HUS1 checkpoint protein